MFANIETQAGKYKGWFVNDEIAVRLPASLQQPLHLSDNLHYLNTGVPHAVTFVESIEKIDVAALGNHLRFSPLFAPAGANVNFVALRQNGSLAIRTYERGVEAETPACGTGATASALIANKVHQLPSPIDVYVRSGERIKIFFNGDWSEVTQQGPVKLI